MPVPSIKTIEKMGMKLLESKNLSEENCNSILEEYYGH
jgi:adenine-specific DNA-methyltransferase